MKPLRECRLYAFIDTAYLNGRDPVELARQLCEGGADLIQLRAKDWPIDSIHSLAEAILPVLQPFGVGLVLNDHPEIARRVKAELCHLGQEDFFGRGFRRAAQITGEPADFGLGLSTHAPAQAQRALEAKPDYVAIGPVFPTATKPGVPAVTLEYVRWAAAEISIPWFAIGGITLRNLDEVLAAGATRVCVVSAILNQSDVARACQEFKDRLLSGAPDPNSSSPPSRSQVNDRRR